MFGKQTSFGHFIVSCNCGIICGATGLHESEGMEDVLASLDGILPLASTRPNTMFYDKACVLDRYLNNNNDDSWAMTRWIVDR